VTTHIFPNQPGEEQYVFLMVICLGMIAISTTVTAFVGLIEDVTVDVALIMETMTEVHGVLIKDKPAHVISSTCKPGDSNPSDVDALPYNFCSFSFSVTVGILRILIRFPYF